MAKDAIERIERKHQERIAEFAEFGIEAGRGHYQAAISLSAGSAEKVLRMLRRLKKLEAAKEAK